MTHSQGHPDHDKMICEYSDEYLIAQEVKYRRGLNGLVVITTTILVTNYIFTDGHWIGWVIAVPFVLLAIIATFLWSNMRGVMKARGLRPARRQE